MSSVDLDADSPLNLEAPMNFPAQQTSPFHEAMSAPGTFRKWWSRCVMSAVGGRPEVVSDRANRRDWSTTDMRISCHSKLAHCGSATCSLANGAHITAR